MSLLSQLEETHSPSTLLKILYLLEKNYSRLDGIIESGMYMDEEAGANIFCARLGSEILEVICNEELNLYQVEQFLLLKKWIDLVLRLGGYKTPGELETEGQFALLRQAILFPANNSAVSLINDLWEQNPAAAVLLAFSYCSSRLIIDEQAHSLREYCLSWLPEKMDQVKLARGILSRAAEVYMHCSYASGKNKHKVKASIHKQMRRELLALGIEEYSGQEVNNTCLVISEQFGPGHATWRTHSQAIKFLYGPFAKTVGLNFPDPAPKELYSEVMVSYVDDTFLKIKALVEKIKALKPRTILYLGVGMSFESIALASLRLAPIQAVSFGHTASTFSPEIDYFLLPKDFIGDEKLFSEKVIGLPQAAMPFTEIPVPEGLEPKTPGKVKIAIPASIMKLNPEFLSTVAEILRQVPNGEAHFFPFAARGLVYFELAKAIRSKIPNAVIHTELFHEKYMRKLAACDLFLSPFPYGNMNSIIDCFQLRIPGVCLVGDEAHAKVDAAIFKWGGQAFQQACYSREEYVKIAVKLATSQRLLSSIKLNMAALDSESNLFVGKPGIFGDILSSLESGS